MKHRKKGTWKNYIFTFEKTELFQRKSLKLRIVINTYKSIGKSITTVDFQGRFPGDRPAYRNATQGTDHDDKPMHRNTQPRGQTTRPRWQTSVSQHDPRGQTTIQHDEGIMCIEFWFFFEMDQCGEEIGRYHNSVFVLGIKVQSHAYCQ